MADTADENAPTAGLQRLRRAIVVVDVVESVRLIQAHEADVVDRWRRLVNEVRTQVLPAHAGRLVKSLGDGMLLEFDRVPTAIAASLEIHDRIAPYNIGRDSDAALHLRIGAHVAEVLVDEFDLYGTGVNLAARLAGLAGPGELVVSAAARDELVDGLHAELRDLGDRYVKHLDEPVRAFAATRPGVAAARPVAAGADLRPVVAVVPFTCLPADPAHDAIGHAVADEINAALARHPGLRVLSRLSTAPFRAAARDPAQLHRLLGAAYLLSGHYYLLGTRVRLAVELCRAPDGQVLWAGHATADIAELFESQDALVPHIVAQVGRQIVAQELARARNLPMSTLQSYTLFLAATGLMNSLVPQDFARAREVLDHLAERHPRQASPYALLAKWHVFKVVQGWAADAMAEGRRAQDLAQRAMEIDPEQPVALTVDGLTRVMFEYDLDGALARYHRALAADPQDPYCWALLAGAQSHTGAHDEARASAAQSIALSPLDPNLFLFEAYGAMAALGAGRHDEAVTHAQASLRLNALHAPTHRLLIGALWLAGREAEARDAAARYLQFEPGARVGATHTAAVARATDRSGWGRRFREALADAGLPL